MAERTKRIDDLIGAEYNPRQITQHDLGALKDSIKRFGVVDPLIVNTHKERENIVIGGHQRLKAAKELGIEEVPVVEVELDKEREKELNIRLNRNQGEWDWEVLAEFDTNLLVSFGFTEDELNFGEEQKNEEDEGPGEPPADPVTKLGDVYELDGHRIVCGDAMDPEIVSKAIASDQPNLMVTDPPYGVEYDPEWRNDALIGGRNTGKVENDDRVDWSEALSMFEGNVIYCWHAGTKADVVKKSLENCGFDVRSQIIWKKSKIVVGRGHYHWQHEPCWYAVRKGGTGNWQGSRKESTVWQIDKNQSNDTGHSTQKPVECMGKPIRNNTAKWEYVFDPFLGSGTTLIAAHQLERKCLGIELSPEYVDVCLKRYIEQVGDADVYRNGEQINTKDFV